MVFNDSNNTTYTFVATEIVIKTENHGIAIQAALVICGLFICDFA
jgi:hypothetical protein